MEFIVFIIDDDGAAAASVALHAAIVFVILCMAVLLSPLLTSNIKYKRDGFCM